MLGIGLVVSLLFVRSRERLGLQGAPSQLMLVDLRDRISAHGRIPALPHGWQVESVVRSAHGEAFSGDFVVAARGAGGPLLEIVLVDVSGKGQEAGVRSLLLSGAFGGLLGAMPPRQFLPTANAYLLEQRWPEGFATAVHLAVRLDTGAFRVARAGHPPAIQLHAASGRVEVLRDAGGPVLGVVTAPVFGANEGVLDHGDSLLLYTDGLVESPSRDLDQGIDRLMGVAERLSPRAAAGPPRCSPSCTPGRVTTVPSSWSDAAEPPAAGGIADRVTAEDYLEAVLDLVAQIPPGRAVTYGSLAEVLRERLGVGGPRQVGSVLSRAGSGVPWWRVVNAAGRPPRPYRPTPWPPAGRGLPADRAGRPRRRPCRTASRAVVAARLSPPVTGTVRSRSPDPRRGRGRGCGRARTRRRACPTEPFEAAVPCSRRRMTAGTPTAVAPAGTSLTTTALAPIFAPSPIHTGPRMRAPEPTTTPSPSVGWRLPWRIETPPRVAPWNSTTSSPTTAVSPITIPIPWSMNSRRPSWAPGWISIPVADRTAWDSSRAGSRSPGSRHIRCAIRYPQTACTPG